MKILNIEDESKVAGFLKRGLEECGYLVDIAADGESGLQMAKSGEYQLIILDWMLPGKSGLEVCQELRQEFPDLPILMLTARGELENLVTGLNHGADDFLAKPFAFEELKARITALLRRHTRQQSTLQFGNIRIDLLTRRVSQEDQELILSNKEFDLLVYFMQNPNQILSREQIARDVWQIEFDRGTNYINVYINYLRSKLGNAPGDPSIQTVRGHGFAFRIPDDKELD
ncbi:MAG TPA: response regulator transcription factor [Calditrichia bacterium]|nr:response regulator transcription factor [Calditrichia bacterium]